MKLLEQAEVVQRSRSEGDHRRTYPRLRPEALAGLVPTGVRVAPRVVFVCTHNSARIDTDAAFESTLRDLTGRVDRLVPAVHRTKEPHG